jgi:polysaccharide biosynthesis/export protein
MLHVFSFFSLVLIVSVNLGGCSSAIRTLPPAYTIGDIYAEPPANGDTSAEEVKPVVNTTAAAKQDAPARNFSAGYNPQGAVSPPSAGEPPTVAAPPPALPRVVESVPFPGAGRVSGDFVPPAVPKVKASVSVPSLPVGNEAGRFPGAERLEEEPYTAVVSPQAKETNPLPRTERTTDASPSVADERARFPGAERSEEESYAAVSPAPAEESIKYPAAGRKKRTSAPSTAAAPTAESDGFPSGQQIAKQPPPPDVERLALLWRKRTSEQSASDYPIGPGDVLEISVPGMEEIKSQQVRVSGDGTITLPLIGTLRAAGLTQEGLHGEIRKRLEADYMHNPQVNIFVREYRSRQVAVIGAVAKPGLHSLASEADTLMDMISQAGGMTDDAAARIHFIPGEWVDVGTAQELVSSLPTQLASASPAFLPLAKRTDPIVIDLSGLARGGSQQLYMAMPARPGDVIMVPAGGEVLVEGWVAKPGSHKITRGLTVLGAIAAAGGPLFAADTSKVKVIRQGDIGEKIFFLADLDGIKKGEQQDFSVHEGDIIEVPYTAVKIVPYGIYTFITTVFRFGAAAPIY